MPITHDIVAIIGEKSDGKPVYKNVGVLIEKNGKQYLKLDSLVTMKNNGNNEPSSVVNFFSIFEHTERGAQQSSPSQASPQPAPADDGFDDDLPPPF